MDFGPDDERLLASLFPEEGSVSPDGPGSTAQHPRPALQDGLMLVAVLICLLVAVIGVDLAFKRVRGAKALPAPWLLVSKMLAGVLSFYAAYWSLRYTTQP